ncbi:MULTISPECIES: DUF3800 domain-containing protein [Exiguobacterium]|uniref:DUF3800 domain-containing protein n=1 Tax=Exiguobacterium TaxID=33986 RepID=UPI0004791358|nr:MULTISPECIES: DUF3800 domain-containing protein [Exiguobacterium]
MKLVFCDESCHIQNDGFDSMVLGAIQCQEDNKTLHYSNIRSIKSKHGVSSWSEIKWVKVSPSKIEMYKELVDYFFQHEDLYLRVVIANGKKELDHEKFNDSDHDTWFYKMYYLLLNNLMEDKHEYRFFLDIKDTHGGEKLNTLNKIIKNNPRYFTSTYKIKDMVQIRSNESELLQLCDLFIGACSYKSRKMKTSDAKQELISYIESYISTSLITTTSIREKKFNRFVWTPRGTVVKE